MKQKFLRKTLTGLAAVSLVFLASCTSGPQSAGDGATTVGLTFIPNVQFSPVYVAEDAGYFTDNGVTATIRHHGSEEGLFNALVAGDEQVTIATGDEVLSARAQGADLVAIGAFYHHYPVQIIVPGDSDVTEIADLKGLKVGLPGEFGSNWYGLLAALSSADMTADDIVVVPTGFTQVAALVSGEVDAIVGFSNSDFVQLEANGLAPRALPIDEADMPLVAATIVTTQEWLDSHPTQAAAVVRSITQGVQAVIDDPNVGLEATVKWDPTLNAEQAREGAEATLLATVNLWKDADGQASAIQDLETWEKMAPFLADILSEPELVGALPGAVTNEYAQ